MQKSENIAIYIIQQLERNKHSCAIKHGDLQLSSKELTSKILSIGYHLHNHRVRTSDVVAINIQNPIDHLAGILAIGLVGATALTHPTSTPKEKLRDWDRRINTKWLLTDSKNLLQPGHTNYTSIEIKDVPERRNTTKESIAIETPSAPWLIATGSGSTGKPKLMPISHLQQIERCRIAETWAPYDHPDTFTSLVAVNFYMGKSRLLECLTVGAKAILVDSKSDLTELNETTAIYATPFHIKQLLRQKSINPHILPNLKHALIAGDVASKGLRREAQKYLCNDINVMYGCNETSSCSMATRSKVNSGSEFVGKPLEGYTIEIVDKNDNQLPNNKVGQIRIKSKCSITHYLDDEEKTEQTFRNEYMYPGDLGFLDEFGQLYFKGREDGMMLFDGINIYPLEIQKCLLSHPNINDTAITSIKHEIHGDLPIALVELSDPTVNTSARELKDFTSNKLGSYYVYQIIIVKALPRNERGKLPKEDLTRLLTHFFSKKKQPSSLLSIGKVVRGRKLSEGRFLLAIPESSEADVRHSCQLLNSILGAKLEPLHTSKDPTIKMAMLTCELTNIFFEAANIPNSVRPTLIDLDNSKENQRIYLLNYHQFPPGIEPAFISAMHAGYNTLYSLRANEITKEQSRKISASIKKETSAILQQVKSSFYGKSSLKLVKYALNNNIPITFRSNGWIQYGWGNQSITMLRSSVLNDSAMGAIAANNKFEAAQVLRELGFPVPQHRIARSRESASAIAKSIKNWPVVIKPKDGERGEGVTKDVRSETELLQAFDYATKYSETNHILIENTIPGTCHRVFIANSNLIYCVKRKPIGMNGNGKDSIEKLISNHTQSSQNSSLNNTNNLKLDEIALKTLKDSGLNKNSIPALDEFVALRPFETTAWGGIDEECTDQIHEDNVQLAIHACTNFNLSICGVDIISNDISTPWHQNGAKINEINFQPLIGGGEASLKTLPKLFSTLLNDRGLIPIHIFVGAYNSHEKARKKHQDLIKEQKHDVYLVSAQSIKGPDKKIIHQNDSSLYNNLTRCLINQNCSKIILVIDSNDILWTGLPVDQCESLEICDTKLYSNENNDKFASDKEYQIIKQELLSLKR